jgi:hypothetical protein
VRRGIVTALTVAGATFVIVLVALEVFVPR